MKQNEKKIILSIRYLPVLFILILSSIITIYIYNVTNKYFEEQNRVLEKNYIALNKNDARLKVHSIKEFILDEKTKLRDKLKNTLQRQVNNAHAIMQNIYENNKHLDETQLKEIIKDALRNIRFNGGRGYFFVYERSGKNILHPFKPNLENKDLWGYQDAKGTFLIREMDKILKKQDETFYSWYWPNKNIEEEKVGFFKSFKPFDWFVGTGEFVSDFENGVKKDLVETISNLKFEKDSYIFILNNEDKYVSYFDKSFIGKSVDVGLSVENPKELIKTFRKMTDMGPTFITYYHKSKPSNKMPAQKTSYIDKIEHWDWIIGSGYFMDDFYKELEEKKSKLVEKRDEAINKILSISIIFTILLLVVFFYLSSIIEKKFYAYKKSINEKIRDNIKKDNVLAHQSKMASMGEMIGNIAHQWRQPLSTISTIVTGLKMQKELGLNDEKDEIKSYEMVNKHVQYLSTTIDDFRNFFNPNKKALKFEIKSTIQKVCKLIMVQYNTKNIILIKNIKNVNLVSLENELIQVLINILNNARDELLKIDDERIIFISTNEEQEFLVIKIRDNAGGVPKEIMSRIFEPYFTTKHQSQGTGVGLYMSEEIIKKHFNGDIKVENKIYDYQGKKYKGAEFIIKIPKNIEN